MVVKLEEIVKTANLNTLTNLQARNKLQAYFPNITMKLYKSRIKQKINEVAKQMLMKQDEKNDDNDDYCNV